MTTKHKAKPIQCSILFSARLHTHTRTHTCRQSATRACIRVFCNLITNFAPLILKLYPNCEYRAQLPGRLQSPVSRLQLQHPGVLRIGNDHNGLNCQLQAASGNGSSCLYGHSCGLPACPRLPLLSSLCTHAAY